MTDRISPVTVIRKATALPTPKGGWSAAQDHGLERVGEGTDDAGAQYVEYRRRTGVVRKVILTAREQRALAWLLSATDNGQIISGSLLPDVMILNGIRKRLGRINL